MRTFLLVLMVLASPIGVAQAANPAAGAAKAKEVCAACHGVDGNAATPDFPRLAGQHGDYLEKALRDYKSGARKNPVMAPIAAALTRTDIENVASHYASQPAALATRY